MRGGLNIALLDILGKATQAPIYRVLGGPTRNKARAITQLAGESDAELQNDLQHQLAAGYRAFLVPIVPPAARNQGSVFAHAAAARLQAMRTAAPGADFALEARAQLTPGDAATLAAAVERLHPLWFDEPCPVSNLETIRKISEETVVPLGFGRTISDPGTFQDLLREGLVDLLRPRSSHPRNHRGSPLGSHGRDLLRGRCAVAPRRPHCSRRIAPRRRQHGKFLYRATASFRWCSHGTGRILRVAEGPGLGITVDEKTLEGNRIA